MNILLTSVGRRAYMVKYFKLALKENGEVHVCNSEHSIAFQYADKCIISPEIYSNEYINFLLDYCKKNSIKILISLFDADLPVLSKNKEKFEKIGTQVIVSTIDIIEICNDKWKTYKYLISNGFNSPKTYLTLKDVNFALEHNEVKFPLIVKPRFGCGSIGVSIAENSDDLNYLNKMILTQIEKSYLRHESDFSDDKIIFQECLTGQEFGADLINDLKGKYINAIIRKKIAMRSGETDIAEIVDNPNIKKILERLGEKTGHIANMDCDIFLINDVPYILEMNARFGGGYPFSHMGGCDLPSAIVKWVKNETVNLELLESQIGLCGYKEIIITPVNKR